LNRAISETLPLSDNTARLFHVQRQLNDAVSSIDNVARSMGLTRSVNDTLAFFDNAARTVVVLRWLPDVTVVSDAVNAWIPTATDVWIVRRISTLSYALTLATLSETLNFTNLATAVGLGTSVHVLNFKSGGDQISPSTIEPTVAPMALSHGIGVSTRSLSLSVIPATYTVEVATQDYKTVLAEDGSHVILA
jgi:hypothetical protein